MIEVKISEEPTEEISFPKLMIHADGCIMLFTATGEGVCLRPGGKTPLGHLTTTMAMKEFSPYNAPITIQNA